MLYALRHAARVKPCSLGVWTRVREYRRLRLLRGPERLPCEQRERWTVLLLWWLCQGGGGRRRHQISSDLGQLIRVDQVWSMKDEIKGRHKRKLVLLLYIFGKYDYL